jgi:hypothetical protein
MLAIERRQELRLDHLDTLQQIAAGGITSGNGPVQIVDYRQQLDDERHGRITALVVHFAAHPLAEVLELCLSP